jgi:hypothetical protein
MAVAGAPNVIVSPGLDNVMLYDLVQRSNTERDAACFLAINTRRGHDVTSTRSLLMDTRGDDLSNQQSPPAGGKFAVFQAEPSASTRQSVPHGSMEVTAMESGEFGAKVHPAGRVISPC